MKLKSFFTYKKVLFLVISIFAIAGLTVSFLLTVEKFQLLQVPDTKLPCSINGVLNCASVMKSTQAEVFGFPNSILGLIGYSMVLIIGINGFIESKYNKSLLQIYLFGAFLAVLFSYWMLFQSVYVIQVLCPFCLVSTFSATMIFFSLSLLQMKDYAKEDKLGILCKKIISKKWYIPIIVMWFVIIIGLIVIQFMDRFK